jgi:glutamate synthase domain-containing protein 3
MVSLVPLPADDVEQLRALVQEHVRRTGSVKGQALLAHFEEAIQQWVKVVPEDYARAVEGVDEGEGASVTPLRKVSHG